MKTKQIGLRIRTFMEQQGVDLGELAERTGLEESFLREIRDHDVYPSLTPLLKIARALGIRLGTFLDDETSRNPLLIRRDERKQELSMLRTRDSEAAVKFYSLGRGKSDRHMEPFFVELMPESSRDKKLSSHEGEEFMVVYAGRVEVAYGRETYLLEAGDSIYYNSIVPHYVSCHGNRMASIYAVLHIPD